MTIAIGIDLGTSNSATAVYRKGRVESIPIEGKKILPSVVSYRDNGQTLVGYTAKSRLFIDPENSVASSKREMGNKSKFYSIKGKTLTPIDIAREILTKIRVEASAYLGEEVKEAVITIPAYFTEEQRKATREAGELAGFNVLRLLPEPTAAAIAYGLDKERDQTIVVYDLGGGTFDVSILKVENNNFRVLAVDGDSNLGGDDFDDQIVQYVMNANHISASRKGDYKGSVASQQLKEAAEQAKMELSESGIADISIPDVFGIHIDEELTIDTYNGLISPLVNRTIDKTLDVIKEAGLTVRDISRIILVGGSTRNKTVREMVTQKIKQPFIADNVDEIVAHGAAILAASLSVPDYDDTPVPIEVEDVTAHSFGIDMLIDNQYEIVHLIAKNTKIPCTGAEIGTTIHKFQSGINFSVYRTEEKIPLEKDKIGELILPINPKPYHVPAVALFELDNDGIITFSSAELDMKSSLLKEYAQTQKVNLQQLQSMIDRREIVPKVIKIDTK
ncbi:Hsp70 family protein [Neobacillus vireti]|uniref:Hsp70 family protein n=1 Tax=Neobacillus vireti TaxID=220686 RepID=UPI002FFFA8D0